MSVTDVRMYRLAAAMFPEADTITLGQWRARVAAGPAPLPDTTATWPICPTCGNPYRRNRKAPIHDYCSRACRIRRQAEQRGGWKR